MNPRGQTEPQGLLKAATTREPDAPEHANDVKAIVPDSIDTAGFSAYEQLAEQANEVLVQVFP